ncbi:DUF4123 domain-containing protein [Alkalilimnicola ehrlichii MLHE-1]|uniref:DUF4123 domain-containing protein n=1 Tax=Alkalilimnicola ehrlichii (strain ATCC BAA-1101 / DSM 17681 / MLHE-1) TaxID=187272 RepID=Q0A9J4_ALKEH|nr:hypothetical protein Mlg_1144 [Alkalilimnicola ehrlichii MLHE-1]
MPVHEWLTRIGERSHTVEGPGDGADGEWVGLIIDPHRIPEEALALYTLDGATDIVPLFAGTELRSLSAYGPWAARLTPGSPAFEQAEMLCRELALGWMCRPPGGALEPFVEQMQRLAVMDDADGGQSLVQVQQPEAWTALLASAPRTHFDLWLQVLGPVYTPTPTAGWRCWVGAEPRGPTSPPFLDHNQCRALDDAPLAWWLGQDLGIPLEAVPPDMLEQLRTLREAGIHLPDEWRRRLAKPGGAKDQTARSKPGAAGREAGT